MGDLKIVILCINGKKQLQKELLQRHLAGAAKGWIDSRKVIINA